MAKDTKIKAVWVKGSDGRNHPTQETILALSCGELREEDVQAVAVHMSELPRHSACRECTAIYDSFGT